MDLKIRNDFTLKGRKVLIVDDSALIRASCCFLLENAGYKVSQAGQASEAIRMIESEPFDLVLLDIIMPEMDGIEACRKIKAGQKGGNIPVIMVSMAEEASHLEQAFEAGAVDYITKPVRKFELLSRAKSALTLKLRELELASKNQQLETALRENMLLQGCLPICAWCKNIRDTQGAWKQMEEYIQKYSLVSFTHGICEPCAIEFRKKTRSGLNKFFGPAKPEFF